MHSSPGTRYSSPPSRGLTSTAFASAPMFTRQRRKSISSAMLWKQSSLMPEGISRGARSGAIHAGSFAPPEERLRSGCITGPVEAIFFTLSHYHRLGAFHLSRFCMAQCQAVPRAKTQPQSDYAQRIDRVIDYLRANLLRPVKAARLLRYSERSLTEIAMDCGFSSSATFSRAFRSGYDTSPSQFRRSGEIKKSKICK